MNSLLVDLLGWTLVHFLWQGAIIAAALWLGLRALSKRAATVRYCACGAALIVLALCPAVTVLALASQRPVVSYQPVAVALPAAQQPTAPAAAGPTASIAGGEPAAMTWLPILVAVWAIGVALLSLRLLGGLFLVERLKRRFCTPATAEWQSRLSALAAKLAIQRRIGLLVSQRVGIPATIGVFRTFVVLPASIFAKMSPDQIDAILVHELAHVARHDYLVNLLQTVLETVLFYQPAVWWVSHVARIEREHCCDDVVVRVCGGPALYAQTLTILEERRRAPSLSLSVTGGPLMNRIRRILGLSPAPLRPSAVCAAAILLLGAVCAGLAATAAGSGSDDRSTPESAITGFVKALGAGDMNHTVGYVKGAKPAAKGSDLDMLGKALATMRLSASAIKVVRQGDQANASFVLKEADRGAPNTTSAHVTARLVREGGRWLIVPSPTGPGKGSVFDSLVFGLVHPEIVAKWKTEAQEHNCISNVHQICFGLNAYALENGETLNLTLANWKSKVQASMDKLTANAPSHVKKMNFFHCPGDAGNGDSYSLNPNLLGKSILALAGAAQTVMVYEGKNLVLDFRHNGKAAVGFADGHVEMVAKADADRLRWIPTTR